MQFNERVKETKRKILRFLIQAKDEASVAGYGAPARTLCSITAGSEQILDYWWIGASQAGLYLPGSRIPVEAPEKVRETKPDYLLILPWNLQDEIMEQMSFIRLGRTLCDPGN